MILADPYVWLDPADAIFVASCREALAIERKAYAAADAERRRLLAELAERASIITALINALQPILARRNRAGLPAGFAQEMFDRGRRAVLRARART